MLGEVLGVSQYIGAYGLCHGDIPVYTAFWLHTTQEMNDCPPLGGPDNTQAMSVSTLQLL